MKQQLHDYLVDQKFVCFNCEKGNLAEKIRLHGQLLAKQRQDSITKNSQNSLGASPLLQKNQLDGSTENLVIFKGGESENKTNSLTGSPTKQQSELKHHDQVYEKPTICKDIECMVEQFFVFQENKEVNEDDKWQQFGQLDYFDNNQDVTSDAKAPIEKGQLNLKANKLNQSRQASFKIQSEPTFDPTDPKGLRLKHLNQMQMYRSLSVVFAQKVLQEVKNRTSDKIKAFQNKETGQIDAATQSPIKPSESKSLIEKKKTYKFVYLKQNAILNSIENLLKKKHVVSYDYFSSLDSDKIWYTFDYIFSNKVIEDLSIESNPVEKRRPAFFHKYVYNHSLMHHGMPDKAIKTLMQVCNGLKQHQESRFASLIQRCLGISLPLLSFDEIQIISKAHCFFELVKQDWIKRISSVPEIQITQENKMNLMGGGDCLVYDLFNQLKVAFQNQPEILNNLLSTLKPDLFGQKATNTAQVRLDFCVLKIVNKIVETKQDLYTLFCTWDTSNGESLDSDELFDGLKTSLGLTFSKDQKLSMSRHLDQDGGGDVSFEEFNDLIYTENYQERTHVFLVSEMNFIDCILSEWYRHRSVERDQVLKTIITMFKSDPKHSKIGDEDEQEGLTIAESKQVLLHFEPTLNVQAMKVLSKKILKDSDVAEEEFKGIISENALAEFIMNHKMKGYGQEFFKDYLNNNLTKIKNQQLNKKQPY